MVFQHLPLGWLACLEKRDFAFNYFLLRTLYFVSLRPWHRLCRADADTGLLLSSSSIPVSSPFIVWSSSSKVNASWNSSSSLVRRLFFSAGRVFFVLNTVCTHLHRKVLWYDTKITACLPGYKHSFFYIQGITFFTVFLSLMLISAFNPAIVNTWVSLADTIFSLLR